MKRITYCLMSTLSAVVLLFSYHTSTNQSAQASSVNSAAVASPTASPTTGTGSTSAGTSSAGTSTSTSTGSSSGSSTGNSSGSSSTSSGSTTSGTYTGDSVDTRWGPVQVQVTVSGGKVTKVEAVVYPTENPRDQEINSYAIPQLNSEATSAGSAQIDMVSGATVTSTGYISSLQSALDKAGL